VTPREWVYSVIAGVVAGVITGPAVIALWRWLQEWRGELTGCWLQVTYAAEDDQMAGPAALVDVLQLRHRGRAIRGTMWRLFPNERKSWTCEGMFEDGIVLATYRARRGGGKGLLSLTRTADSWWLKGAFLEPFVRPYGAGIVIAQETAPMEWLRRDRCFGAPLARWLEALPGVAQLKYPLRVRIALLGALKWRRLSKRAASGTAPETLARADILGDRPPGAMRGKR